MSEIGPTEEIKVFPVYKVCKPGGRKPDTSGNTDPGKKDNKEAPQGGSAEPHLGNIIDVGG